jgi:aldehyde:ferredoxin oxidoreductase
MEELSPQNEIDSLHDFYYKSMRWNPKTGAPTRDTLEELDLEYVAEEFQKNLPYPDWAGPPLWELEKYPNGGPPR